MENQEKNDQPLKTILVADLSHTVRLLIKKILDGNYEILEAESGEEIFSMIAKKQVPGSQEISMLILSLEFSDYHAFQISEKLRKNYSNERLPILLNTSNNKREIIIKALRHGINDFIMKPFPQELLLSKVRKLERKISLQDLERSQMIAKIPIFHGVPESQVAFILDTCSETVDKEKGEAICEENEENFDLFILMEGKCDVVHEERKVGEIKAVDTIGEMGFVGEQKRSASVVASEPSKVVILKKDLFDEYLYEERAILEIICRNIILSLNERIRKSNDMVKKLKIMAEEYLSY